MNQLNCLPQDAIFWGHDILPYANEIGDLGDGHGATLNGFLESLW
ncbi:MAG: hypothetical protein ACREYA_25105 [Cupriavidus necator]